MASRWQKRSQAEKERIYQEQVVQQQEKKHEDNALQRGQQRGIDVYNAGEIPIYCYEHGWVGSDHYRLFAERHQLMGADPVLQIEGTCRKCKKKIRRVCAGGGFIINEGIVFTAMSRNLQQEGRLTDEREVSP